MREYNRLSRNLITKLIRCFCIDIDATKTAELLRLNRKTVNRYFRIFREKIYENQLKEAQYLGLIEVDESYFGPSRLRGQQGSRRGRGMHKQPVFGLIERNGRVYTEIIPDCSRSTLMAVIKGKISVDSIIFSDRWSGYDGLVDVGYDKHIRITKKTGFAKPGGVHINGIEAFWSFTKRRLAKFNGVKTLFQLHLKECEWRYGKSSDNMFKELKEMMV